ncbi:MAG TPA: 50S ribosomal protein L21 [Candidatus Limnocylindrales bacterium]|nr:50S ribosomal protein L21 [Candidatus Limnocylindrales bacterium]
MYAVVTTGGKQYRVEAGSELVIERLAVDAGASFTFDRVLLVGDGEAITVGTPTVDGASVTGTVLGEELGPKLIIFKFKQKATYRRTRGHRQHLVRVRIDEISAGGKSVKAEKPAATAAAPAKAAKAAKAAKPEKGEEAVAAEKPASRAAAAKPAKAKAPSKTDEVKKPSRTRKPAAAAKADATDAPAKPAPRRRTPAKKAESKE